VDKEKFRQFIELEVDDETLKRFRETEDGALLGADFVERYPNLDTCRILAAVFEGLPLANGLHSSIGDDVDRQTRCSADPPG